MKLWKHFLSLMLALALCLCLAACGKAATAAPPTMTPRILWKIW